MTTDLPERWDDEPWPLDEPDIGAFRVQNRSDSYDDVPQVADLAEEAWEYALDHGVSMERALVEVQGRRFHTGGVVHQPTRVTFVPAFTPAPPTSANWTAYNGDPADLPDIISVNPAVDPELIRRAVRDALNRPSNGGDE